MGYSIAGTDHCLKKLQPLMESKLHGWKVKIWLANQSFHLNSNGTDLEFINARTTPQAKEYYGSKIGNFQAKMKCGIWDWGDRFEKPLHHLQEIEEYFTALPDSPQYIVDGIAAAMYKVKKPTAGTQRSH